MQHPKRGRKGSVIYSETRHGKVAREYVPPRNPRTAQQMYEGHVDLHAFADCLSRCRHTVVYNGDIRTAADGDLLRARFPAVRRWMLGRGLVADPFLAEQLRNRDAPRDLGRLRAFLDDLLAVACEESHGDQQVLGRLKELWGYLAPGLCRDELLLKRIHLCRRVDEDRRTVDGWFERHPQWVAGADGLQMAPGS